MSVVGGLKGGLKTVVGLVWAITKKVTVRLAIAAAIVTMLMVLVDRGEGSAAESTGAAEAHTVVVRPALLSEEAAGEQLMLCRYKVKAVFGVSIFTDTTMSSKRLVRIRNGDEIYGSCFAREGGKALSCAGLAWDYEWIRVNSGTTVGWSPASCFERVGFL